MFIQNLMLYYISCKLPKGWSWIIKSSLHCIQMRNFIVSFPILGYLIKVFSKSTYTSMSKLTNHKFPIIMVVVLLFIFKFVSICRKQALVRMPYYDKCHWILSSIEFFKCTRGERWNKLSSQYVWLGITLGKTFDLTFPEISEPWNWQFAIYALYITVSIILFNFRLTFIYKLPGIRVIQFVEAALNTGHQTNFLLLLM